MKIIIVSHDPLIPYIEEIFCIKALQDSGFIVEYWDISELVDGSVVFKNKMCTSYSRVIDSFELLKEMVLAEDVSTIFVLEFALHWKNYKVVNLFKSFKWVKIDLYANTMSPTKVQILKNSSLIQLIKRGLNFVVRIITERVLDLNKVDLFFTSNSFLITNDKSVRVNHPDYIKFLQSNYTQSEDSIVFIDNYYPEHPDLIHRLKFKKADPIKYRKSLNDFFSFLENTYNLPVVIAAHPKSDYAANDFEGRSIVKFQTEKLVAGAKFVVQHTSNAISYAILSNKPLLLIVNDEYVKCDYLTSMVERIASKLSLPIINIDQTPYNNIVVDTLSSEVRTSYINTYLTSDETNQMFNKDIFIKHFNTLF